MSWRTDLSTNKPIAVPRCVAGKMVEYFHKMPLNSTNRWMVYKAVIRQRNSNGEEYDIRVFDEGEAQLINVKVDNYSSLDKYLNLIQFEGWFNPKSKTFEIEAKNQVGK